MNNWYFLQHLQTLEHKPNNSFKNLVNVYKLKKTKYYWKQRNLIQNQGITKKWSKKRTSNQLITQINTVEYITKTNSMIN